MSPVNPIAHSRRVWKSQAIRALSRLGVDINSVRQAMGLKRFGELLDEVYRLSPRDPDKGATLVSSRLNEVVEGGVPLSDVSPRPKDR